MPVANRVVPHQSTHRLLVVDDEPAIRRLILRLLAFEGHPRDSMAEAGSAEEALALLQRERFDLVLTDFRMTRMSGAELLAWLREHQPWVRRCLMTGYQEDRAAVEGLELGEAHALLRKPWDNQELTQVVRELLTMASSGPAGWDRAAAGGAARPAPVTGTD